MPSMPTGYVYNAAVLQETKSYCAASASPINGLARTSISGGRHYRNLSAAVAQLLRKDADKVVRSQRKLIDLGDDGVVMDPLAQETGICSGCSHGEESLVGMANNYVINGQGEMPSEGSFLFAYLAGRDDRYVPHGDTGAIPGLTVRAFHDFGVLLMSRCPELAALKPHGPGSQEALCIQYRDNPRAWLDKYISRTEGMGCRVYSPPDAWDVADCIESLRPVTFGCSYQANAPQPGGNGVSSLYHLGGHETFAVGWFTLNGRLGFIKRESWGNVLPGRGWPNNRVTIMTDAGPKTLYPGEVAVWADEWMACQPECWAIDAPGSRN